MLVDTKRLRRDYFFLSLKGFKYRIKSGGGEERRLYAGSSVSSLNNSNP